MCWTIRRKRSRRRGAAASGHCASSRWARLSMDWSICSRITRTVGCAAKRGETDMGFVRRYIDPSDQWRDYIADPVRLFIILCSIFVLCYGTRKGINSPFEFEALDHLIGDSFTIVDVVLIGITVIEIVRRLVIDDLS